MTSWKIRDGLSLKEVGETMGSRALEGPEKGGEFRPFEQHPPLPLPRGRGLYLCRPNDKVPCTVPGPAGLQCQRCSTEAVQWPELSVGHDGREGDPVKVHGALRVAVLDQVARPQLEDRGEGPRV